jgi:hypothetical protein
LPGKSGINVRSAHGISIGTTPRTRNVFVAFVQPRAGFGIEIRER